ncbi:MAG: SusC/RagA family TonB-linked outer membrane protein [Gemmatimonadetes bacterium]|nr:SusC/RagA family TonB-linked outer membrane protein [Gemmatimonadota bacterium]MDA1104305.1 SusC/RagA family TonB-linked outer membrane protein [Gemmatimonadota bacterium]
MVSNVVRSTPPSWRAGLMALLAFALVGASAPALQAQTGQITGNVTNAASGAALGEVQVFLEGRQLGTLTRSDGRYLILNVPVGAYQVTAQRIGFGSVTQAVTVTAGSAAAVNFSLSTQALGLDEIVVTGTAGASRRREVGNSIAQINIADVPDRPVSAVDMLQGAAPGIDVMGASGEAGQGRQIRLRGNSSVSMTNNPIIYIDGIRMRSDALPIVNSLDTGSGRGARVSVSPLDNLNPNDIERIEIIKGSAATTLYGTEASAGVIQVFTKRGSTGAPVWTAEVQQGTGWMQEFGVNGMDYLNMEHYMRDALWGGGYEGGEFSVDCATDATDTDNRWQGENATAEGACSWPGAIWMQNYSLSVRGGGQALQYFISGQLQDDQYALPNDELEKYNFRGNFTMTPTDNLQIQWNTGYTNQWQANTSTANNAQGVTLNAFRQERNYWGSGDPTRIAEAMDYDLQQTVERLSTGMTANYTPLANMTNRFTVGYDFTQQEGRNLRNFGFTQFPRGSITNDTYQNRLLTFEYVGSYAFSLTESVGSNFSWGGQAVGDEDRRLQGYGENFPGAAEPTVSSAALTFARESRQKVWNAGFFVQNVFDFSDKYFLTGGVRVDGNSAFGSGFGLQVYPKVSAVWIMSDEDFFSDAMGTFKLRAAYGQSGRAPGAFDAVRTWNPAGFVGLPAFTPSNLGNANLGPEVTAEWEVGFDASWFSDRVNAVFTYYNQRTTDALMNVAAIPSSGFTSSQLQNVGEVGNTGVELQLDGSVYQSADWGVDLGFGFSTNNSEVISLCSDPADLTTCIAEFSDLNGRIIEGYPVPVQWDRRTANPDNVDGTYQYACDDRDPLVEGDYPSLTVGGCTANLPIGPQLPTTFMTPSLTVRVPGNISLSARGEFRGGHFAEIAPIPVGRSVRSALCFPWYVGPAGFSTPTSKTLALKPETPNGMRERCTPAGARDNWYKADYFKLRSVSATIPMDFAFPDRVSGATLTLALQNAFDWYKEIPWYDAEIQGNAAAGDDGIGQQTERIPSPATFRMSLRVTF